MAMTLDEKLMKPILYKIALIAVTFWLTSCASVRENDFTKPLGSKENPVRCDGPAGEREYLSRLTGPDGEKIIYYRVGSFDEGPDGHILDGYEFGLEDEGLKYFIFMDMYHEGYYERQPIEGFKIRNVE